MDEALKTNRIRSKEFFTKYLSGKIIDIGTHNELIKNSMVYKNLYSKQLSA